MAVGIRHIENLLARHHFKRVDGERGVSSGGGFTTCKFKRGDLELGIIVRSASRLGCPNYSEGKGYASHTDLIRHLGCSGSEELVQGDELAYEAKEGGDPFMALRSDLLRIILPALEKAEPEFRAAIRAAHEDFMRSLSSKRRK